MTRPTETDFREALEAAEWDAQHLGAPGSRVRKRAAVYVFALQELDRHAELHQKNKILDDNTRFRLVEAERLLRDLAYAAHARITGFEGVRLEERIAETRKFLGLEALATRSQPSSADLDKALRWAQDEAPMQNVAATCEAALVLAAKVPEGEEDLEWTRQMLFEALQALNLEGYSFSHEEQFWWDQNQHRTRR